ncbi:glycosyltransferase family A protein [Collinsella ihumii]|uniref:glycosyltransferase family A protein n=1 Tax=Collinsella ihumii TaxID=1720204 RepID=UPI0025AB2FC9|nr:glycosyltransferase family A protein [Collinsella ihumii]MDN0055075.1 glycosyltransferase family A protein [Collinsella ihumii]
MSVIIPMYNHERYIADCLKSIAAQKYDNIELLIADDGSTDDSYSIAVKTLRSISENRFQKRRIIKNEINLGLCKNLNRLIKKAAGKYIKIIASDDMLLPDALTKLVFYLETHPDEGAVLSNVAMVKESAHVKGISIDQIDPFYSCSPIDEVNPFKHLYENGDNLLVAGLMVRRNLYEKHGLYDESLTIEDWDFWLRIFSSGEKVGWLKDPTALYRVLPGSLSHPDDSPESHKKMERSIHDELSILKKYRMVDGVSYRKGLTRLINSRISACLKANYMHGVNHLIDIAKTEGGSIYLKTYVKLVAHAIGLY